MANFWFNEDEMICENCKRGDQMEDTRDGDLVCTGCGVVAKGRRFDPRCEQNVFEEEEKDGVRVHEAGTALDDNALRQSSVGGARNAQTAALYQVNKSLENKEEVKYTELKRKLKEYADRATLDDATTEHAWQLVKGFAKKMQGQIKDCDDVLLSCLYIACREQRGRTTRSLEEFSELSTKKTRFAQLYNKVKQICDSLKIGLQVDTTTGQNFTTRFGSKLGMMFRTYDLATQIAQRISDESLLEGRKPKTIAALALWLASHLNSDVKSIDEICGIAKVKPETVKKSWSDVQGQVDRIIPADHQTSIPLIPRTVK